jgi:excisionase family DNA binding protein
VSESAFAAFAPALEQLAELIVRRVVDLQADFAGEQENGAEVSPWMGSERAARYLDWPKQRLYKLVATGALPHFKQEGRLLFRRDELDAWLAQFAQGERDSLDRRSES